MVDTRPGRVARQVAGRPRESMNIRPSTNREHAMTITMTLSADLAPTSATRQFSAYGPSHLTVLVAFAIGAAALVWIGHRQTESQARLFGRILAAMTMALFTVALVYKLIQPAIDHSVPLQLCDLAELTAAYALWTRRKWAFTLSY